MMENPKVFWEKAQAWVKKFAQWSFIHFKLQIKLQYINFYKRQIYVNSKIQNIKIT